MGWFRYRGGFRWWIAAQTEPSPEGGNVALRDKKTSGAVRALLGVATVMVLTGGAMAFLVRIIGPWAWIAGAVGYSLWMAGAVSSTPPSE